VRIPLLSCACVHSGRSHFDDAVQPTWQPVCVPCFIGTACHGTGATRERLPVQHGYWRPSSDSLSVVRCPDASLRGTGCRGGDNISTSCADGLKGPLCRLCKNDHPARPSVYYQPATGKDEARCLPCDGMLGLMGVWAAAVLVCACVAYGVLSAIRRRRPAMLAAASVAWTRWQPEPKIKILLGVR
jgi:hypothetical protein